MDTGAKPAAEAKPSPFSVIPRFFKANRTAILLTAIGIVIGGFVGYWANEHFYVETLKFTILDLKAEKRALERDLERLREENRSLNQDLKDLQLKLGIKPEQRAIEPTPERVTVKFTNIPSQGQGADSAGIIKGRVEGLARPEMYKIVIYAHTDRWYVQPFADQPITNIDSNGTWEATTHLGTRYAALVVKHTFFPLSTPEELPPTGDDILASATTLPTR